MRILIADDDSISLELLEYALTKEGYEVTTASNGQEALAKVRNEGIRLIISDWDMPELSGVEFCREIRNEDLGGYVYFILLTARNHSSEIVEGLSAGADDFIAKPFNTAELIVRIRSGERILSLETREMAIFALAKLAESRDPETGHHLERVRNYCRALAKHVAAMPKYRDEVTPEYIRLLYQTSPLHDIGKVGIPDYVLLKPGRLSQAEFEIMKKHTILGASTLEAALDRYPEAKFLQIARDIALTHHERYDGSGYPYGIKGDAIPLCGRIVAIADVYDALTSKRVYKAAFEHSEARSIILKDSGTHFDPDMVDAFLAAENEFIAIRERYQEADEPLACTTLR
jgi:putative two-component system response regulator